MFILKKNIALRLLLILAMIMILITACGKKAEKPKLPSKEEKIPESLKAMQEKNEDLIKEIEKIVEEMKKPEKPKEEEKKSEKDEKSNGDNEEKKSDSEGEKKSDENQKKTSSEKTGEEKSTETKQEKINTMWEVAKKTSEEIHTSWGNYEILAIENGIKKPELSKYEEAINNLTVAVEEKNILKSLNYSNEITYNMTPFFDSYKGNHEGELMRLNYFARQALIYGMEDEWNKSEDSIKQAEESMSMIRAKIKLDKKDQELMEKLNLSIINMKTSIPKKNIELTKIKRDIVLKNVDEIKGKL
ncbi:hypothetical protein [Proteiniborus sp. MB09-C3]|uniref:hypothetical protein n=1 Tax=Proteiniborus sp. MB09-C3 TaxID=3050072 RepID=UPI00255392CA|nr:hypothetical protein [Proteiniborus sp. MB09-C3]WIV11755.1 hypothetical protein QO263_16885 [Proteiniborus sp. MB09-C3]